MSNAYPRLVADRYRLLEPLGQGGMGRVWKARDEVLHRDVAIKELVPPPGLTEDERREMRERSLREARAIARLNHINVVRVFDVLRTDGDPWIVMEYVASRSLHDVLQADGPVTPVRAAEIGLGMLGALQAAHRSGVMHRDVKPGNVLIGDDGRVVLTDFGLATVPGDPNVTRTGLVLGSPAYIAPERAKDGTAGPQGDLWSLGATLYAAVEGQSPYARQSAIATLAALATEPPPPPKNAGPLKGLLAGLLRKDPTQRMTAVEAERQLRRIVHKRPRAGISLLDGVRRPGPNGPREPRTRVIPAPPTPPVSGAAPVPTQRGGRGPAEKPTKPEGQSAKAAAAAAAAAAATPVTESIADPSANQAPSVESGTTSTPDKPGAADQAGAPDQVGAAEQAGTPDKTTASDKAEGSDKAGVPDETSPSDKVGASDEPGAPEQAGTPDEVSGSDKASAPVEQAASAVDAATRVDNAAVADSGAGRAKESPTLVDSPPVTDEPEAESAAAAAKSGTKRAEPTSASSGAAQSAKAPVSGGPASSAPAVGRAPIVAGLKERALDGNRKKWLIGALAAVLLIALLVIVPLVNRGSDSGSKPGAGKPSNPAPSASNSTPPAASATPSTAPTSAASAPSGPVVPPIPAGWHLEKDPKAFSIPVPDGWTRSVRDSGTSVVFSGPNGRVLLIQQTDTPAGDPAADWKRQEPNRKDYVQNYQYLSIRSVPNYFKACADWDWLQTRNGKPFHVRNRGFVTAKDRAYAIRWEIPADEWDAQLANFNMLTANFKPER